MDETIQAEIAKVIAADADFKVEYDLPQDAEIHFFGEPILSLNQATNNLTAPSRLLRHPLVESRYFFTLPGTLWNAIIARLGNADFGAELMELEHALSSICRDHSTQAGFWKGRAFPYRFLRPPAAFRPSAAAAQALGWEIDQAKLDHALQVAEERSAMFRRVTRAYTGWLLTNRDFLTEHDQLFAKWSPMVQRWGLERLGVLQLKSGYLPGDDPLADSQWPEYRAAFEEFFIRWRLQGLAAPYLPTPLQPLLGGGFPVSVASQINRAGGAFCYPDIFPVSSRDGLRNLMEDAIHGGNPPEHLKEWMALVAGSNPAKKPFIKFARLLELQHYWRILHSRHGAAIYRKAGILKEVLATFLEVSTETVHRDLLWITKGLGKDWVQRGPDFIFGPFAHEQPVPPTPRPR